MQTHTKTEILEQTRVNEKKEELKFSREQRIMEYYYLKYQDYHRFVIGDNKLKHNVEVMIGKQTLYCSYHDTRDAQHNCEHIKFIKMLEEIQN